MEKYIFTHFFRKFHAIFSYDKFLIHILNTFTCKKTIFLKLLYLEH
jgi:hypothetical protein